MSALEGYPVWKDFLYLESETCTKAVVFSVFLNDSLNITIVHCNERVVFFVCRIEGGIGLEGVVLEGFFHILVLLLQNDCKKLQIALKTNLVLVNSHFRFS